MAAQGVMIGAGDLLLNGCGATGSRGGQKKGDRLGLGAAVIGLIRTRGPAPRGPGNLILQVGVTRNVTRRFRQQHMVKTN